jgi:hypothetical protein
MAVGVFNIDERAPNSLAISTCPLALMILLSALRRATGAETNSFSKSLLMPKSVYGRNTFEADVVDSDAPVGDYGNHLLFDIMGDFCLFLKQLLEGEDGNSVFDDSSTDFHQGRFQVVHSEVIQMRMANVVVDAGIDSDGYVVFVSKALPRVIRR